MLIDWFTVGAQLINFLLLAWLLKRFLYQPILDAIDAREKRIADELASAKAEKSEAEQLRQDYEQKNTAFEQQKSARLHQLEQDTKADRAHMLDEIKSEANALKQRLAQTLENEQRSLQHQLSGYVKDEVFAISRKALSELADTSLEAQIAARFITRLRALSEKEKAALKAGFAAANQTLLVRSAFELQDEQQALIAAACNDILGDALTIEFSQDAELACGIEISATGQKIAWNIAEYLTAMSKGVNDILKPEQNEPSDSLASADAAPPLPVIQDSHESRD
ncbi:F0F1 ATP synthase subunit B family protein [Rheinheimera maricola]|uniref:ATP synthase subunit b n=1 Tax=Rheinheimera maricola TaxID=2793282 RepID=A0ABS7XA72_9GAMM|nr:F0F1 ATP synthase subunit B [Rheinheimera maricola]MBZ9612459.1 F0F1 ATP synthase subunit B [Rheinheimera maricola]